MTAAFPRPKFHMTPPANWLSDPNGLVWADGYWHLYYQHNPHGEEWGHMSWGHARSADLVEWESLPPALLECEAHFIFSGCAVIDHEDSAGFGANALIALYTAAHADESRQAQHLAVSHDGGVSFVPHDDNPVLDLGLIDFRDPNVFWHPPTHQWVMVVALSAEHRAALFGSNDLRAWHHLSDIGPWDAPGQVWECPMLIELPVEGTTNTRWLFKVDVLTGGPGSGALALSGTFDGTHFHHDRCRGEVDWQQVDGGSDFYAAVPWHEPRDSLGRPCWIGWTGNHGYQGKLPLAGWRGAMSSPRRLSLRHEDDRYRLVQEVEPALAAKFVRKPGVTAHRSTIDLELASRLSFRIEQDSRIALSVTAADGQAIRLDIVDCQFRFNRAAGFDASYDSVIAAALAPGPITIWLDAGIIEIESTAGRDWFSAQHRLFGDRVTLDIDMGQPMTIDIAAFDLTRTGPSAIDGDVEGQA